MARWLLAAAVCLVAFPAAPAEAPRLTEGMIRSALTNAHIDTKPGGVLLLLDGKIWRAVRIDKFSVHVHDGHFTIEGDTTTLN